LLQLAELHPVLTHFPIALLTTAFLFQMVTLLWPKWMAATVPLWVLGLSVAITLFTVLSGEAASDVAVAGAGVSQEVADLIACHEQLGNITIWGSLILFGGWFWLRLKFGDSRLLGIVALVWLLFLMLVVFYSGNLGGSLVFDHGIGS
jgi:uncharacterized membrane protein